MQFIKIFVVYAQLLEFINFSGLNVSNLLSFILNFLSNFSTLLQVVQSILLLLGFVGADLGSDFHRVVDKGILLLLFDQSFLSFNLFLLLNLGHVVLSLDSSLLCKTGLFLIELDLSSNLKVSLDSLSLLVLESFSFSGLSLALFESSLGPQGVDLSLSVGRLLLQLS